MRVGIIALLVNPSAAFLLLSEILPQLYSFSVGSQFATLLCYKIEQRRFQNVKIIIYRRGVDSGCWL